MPFTFSIPTNFVFGAGSVQKRHRQRLPGKKALIVISSGKSTRANGYLDAVQDQLTQAGVEFTVFDKISANPVIDNVMDGAACARENGWMTCSAAISGSFRILSKLVVKVISG